ncbi:efflux RND transporter permease subunit [Pelagicoccus sp. SDUM812003]|uniref:efflux RND transporter permease subunit n=1 Tax=Pelagicoccus sp. SDUM812003 TaxID=3041267 RepID=UPI00280E92BD|nr:efflux RND transporter permease subunit [Pelagicoccus sp. SDUM812003]MDQ8203391.1 efflux RND transporter permease subunit [Pelagicoccus sp. SDUM812003]
MARFFIDRPIFSWVIALVIMIAGALAMTTLPISRYPTVAPPSVSVNAMYPGASAQVVEDSVTQILEQSLTGLDGLIYMSATSDSSGTSTITLTFATGTDPDIAQVQVQNKLQAATPLLPSVVQQQGVNVTKSGEGFLMVVGFVSEDGSMDRVDVADYLTSNIADQIARVDGVGGARVFGGQYAMRIWLDPNVIDAYGLTVTDITSAVTAQNQQVSIGQIGGAPYVDGQNVNFSINTKGRLTSADEFEQIVVRSNSDGSYLKLKDVARVELGASQYGFETHYNGKQAAGMAISLASGANALETASRVTDLLDELEPYFPESLRAVIPFDNTPFVRVAIEGVVHTLIEAVVLVFLVMFLFLQNWRATLIPTIAIPVVLLGTFGVLAVLGFSINMLTMFAMILAIGLLVDDAIVVVENVERLMSEEGLSPKEAAKKSMDQITGALIGIGVVLSAVFVPMAFLGGATGVIYRQFSATIVSAMALSVIVAIVFTPALCATMLKPIKKGHHVKETGFFGWFNRMFDKNNGRYQGAVRRIISYRKSGFVAFLAVVGLMAYFFLRLPTSFLPNEDQGSIYVQVIGPVGSTADNTLEVLKQVEDYMLNEEKDVVEELFTVQGFSFAGGGQSNGMGFVSLKDWSERPNPEQSAQALAMRASMAFSQIQGASVFAFAPPPITELGNSTGFTLYLKDNAGQGHEALMAARNQLLGMAAQNPKLTKVRPNGQEDTPQLRVTIDNAKAKALGLSIAEINNTLGVAWGGRYIDDFIDRGRVKRVYVQADAPYRMQPEDFEKWSVRNSSGEMVPFSSFGSTEWAYGSPRLERYNGVSAVQIVGEGVPGVSSGEAMLEMEKMAQQLPEGFGIEWTATSYQERQAGDQTTLLYALSLMIVFLALAALYESWSIPTAVLLAAPLGIVGAVLANMVRGYERDVYFQVAMLTTVGLTSKNAILIVEFAKENLESGMKLLDATLHAVRDRLRPILMTSLAFGLGVVPLVIADGAGSGAQRAIGTGVLGGMIVGTALGIFFVPLFFFLIERLFIRKKGHQSHA